MKQVVLGRTGLSVSHIGFGGLQIASKLTDREAVRLVRRSLDEGINLVETARGYMQSEERIGKALAGGRRQKVFLATKNGQRDPKAFLKDIDTSLEKLRTDYIDLFMFHGVDGRKDLTAISRGGLMEAAEKAVRAGKIRHLGFSGHVMDVALKLVKKKQFSFLQYPLNYVGPEAVSKGLLKEARRRNMGFLVMKPFGGGRLGNARYCLGYLLRIPDIVVLPGFESVEEVRQAVRMAEHPPRLSERDRKKMAAIKRKLGRSFCRGCRYCEPCPQGIAIQRVMWFPVLVEQFHKKQVITGFEYAPVMEAVGKCTECRICESRCPFGLKIPGTLRRNRELFKRLSRG